jgi:hypothetical protein
LFASCIGGVVSAEFLTPLPDRFVGNLDAALGQKIFDIAKAQLEAVVEPHGMTDDLSGNRYPWYVGVGLFIPRVCRALAQVDNAPLAASGSMALLIIRRTPCRSRSSISSP